MNDGLIRARSLADLERMLGVSRGAAEGASGPPRRARPEELTVDDSRVGKAVHLEMPDESVMNRMTATIRGAVPVAPIQTVDVGQGIVSTMWGPVFLTETERVQLAKLVTKAVRRSWEDSLTELETPRKAPRRKRGAAAAQEDGPDVVVED